MAGHTVPGVVTGDRRDSILPPELRASDLDLTRRLGQLRPDHDGKACKTTNALETTRTSGFRSVSARPRRDASLTQGRR